MEAHARGSVLLGTDDCVVKPFSPAELVARVDAVLRRVDTAPKIEPDSSRPRHIQTVWGVGYRFVR